MFVIVDGAERRGQACGGGVGGGSARQGGGPRRRSGSSSTIRVTGAVGGALAASVRVWQGHWQRS